MTSQNNTLLCKPTSPLCVYICSCC